jgi:hypothetical protein
MQPLAKGEMEMFWRVLGIDKRTPEGGFGSDLPFCGIFAPVAFLEQLWRSSTRGTVLCRWSAVPL